MKIKDKFFFIIKAHFIAILLSMIFNICPSFGFESEIYGRRLIDIDVNYIEKVKPRSTEPKLGEFVPEEWRTYYRLEGLLNQQMPVWSPDGSFIAFVAGSFRIAVVSTDGGVPTTVFDKYRNHEYQGYYLTSGPIRDICFSSNGEEIFFETVIIDEAYGTQVTLNRIDDTSLSEYSIHNLVPVIMAVTIETGEARILKYYAGTPRFSRDGRYYTYSNFYSGLFVKELSTGTEWNLADIYSTYCISGDSEYIIHIRDRRYYRSPIRGGDPELLPFDTSGLSSLGFDQDCSPDGNNILYSGDGGPRSTAVSYTSSFGKIFFLDMESGVSQPVFPVEDNIEAENPKFSPDGYEFCYTRRNCDFKDGIWQIFIQDFDDYSDMGITHVQSEQSSQCIILQNYPNPFNPTTTISYSLAESDNARLVVYNSLGQQVRTLADGPQVAGVHVVQWDGRDENGQKVSSGVYFYRLIAGRFMQTNRMMMVE